MEVASGNITLPVSLYPHAISLNSKISYKVFGVSVLPEEFLKEKDIILRVLMQIEQQEQFCQLGNQYSI